MKRPSLLAVGDGIVPTGFSRVLHSLLARLQSRFKIYHLALGYRGDPIDLEWPIFSSDPREETPERLAALIDRVDPQIVLLLNDVGFLGQLAQSLRNHPRRRDFHLVGYCALDHSPLPIDCLPPLQDLDHLVLYTATARRDVESSLARFRTENEPEADFPPISVIAHGIDSERFRPHPPGVASRRARKKVAGEALFNGQSTEEWFVVLNANRNQPRKRIDLTLQGFALFAADKGDDVRLFLHMGAQDLGWPIFELAKRLGVEDRLICSTSDAVLPNVSDETLNHIYNLCDVGISTAEGEGWGLVPFEHAATGAAQVVPNHTAYRELWTGSAEMVEPATTVVDPGNLVESHLVSPQAVADALERLYRDPGRLSEMSKAAYRNATRPDFSWDLVADEWLCLFGSMLDRHRLVEEPSNPSCLTVADTSKLESLQAPMEPPPAQ